jgi:hypothetical protein
MLILLRIENIEEEKGNLVNSLLKDPSDYLLSLFFSDDNKYILRLHHALRSWTLSRSLRKLMS